MELKSDVMGQLRDRYRRSLPDKRQQLEQLRDRLRQGEPCVEEIRRLAHRYSGSGASYGWPEISDAAAKVELADETDLPSTLDVLIVVFNDADQSD